MTTIANYMSGDHRHCDAIFAAAESAVDEQNWELAKQQTGAFLKAMEEHFSIEESVLFPAFEQATGMAGGPTQVMRYEHQQMRSLFAEMEMALAETDEDEFLSVTETLLIMMQQHNMKEEGIIYAMSDTLLGPEDVSSVLSQIHNIAAA